MRMFALRIGLIILVTISAYLLAVGFLAVKGIESTAEDNLRKLQALFEGETFPKDRTTRRFLFIYEISQSTPIDVADESMEDWISLHQATVKPGGLGEDGFLDSHPRVGTSRTPYDIDVIQTLPDEQGQRLATMQNVPNLRLWFARDPTADHLYLLAHIANVGSGNSVGLSLTVHHSKPTEKERVFSIYPQKEGDLRIYEITPSPETRRYDELSQEQIHGKRWQSDTDQFFELVLYDMRDGEAIELIARLYRGEGVLFGLDPNEDTLPRALFEISPPNPLPLEEEIGTYAISKLLRRLSRYEVWRGQDLLLASEMTDETMGIRPPWLLKPVYAPYLFLISSGIRHCTEQAKAGICFVNAEGYQLRLGRALPGDYSDITVLTAEPLVIRFWGLGLAVVASVLLGFLLAFINHRRRRTFVRLEEIIGALRMYVGTFLHQARRRLDRARAKARKFVEDADGIPLTEQVEEVEEIDKLLASVKRRLLLSTEVFEYEAIVRSAISQNGKYKFDLCDSVNELIGFFAEDGVGNIEFRSILRGNRRPVLSATAPPEGEYAPDSYFTEAMETIIQNAIDYRDSQKNTITVSLGTERGRTVLEVFNYGPLVPADKLENVFDLGSRYAGRASGKEHLGLGLFLTSQIIRAYRGSCQLENFHDAVGWGVRVTVRLPVEFA